MDIDWQYIQNNFDWLGHIAEAFCIAAVVTVLGLALFKRRTSLIIGVAFASGHFHIRGKRDFEVSVRVSPSHLEGYEMWKWSWDQASAFWPVTIVMQVSSFSLCQTRDCVNALMRDDTATCANRNHCEKTVGHTLSVPFNVCFGLSRPVCQTAMPIC